MDIYMQKIAANHCSSHQFWVQLRKAGKPDVVFERLKCLMSREALLFFPKDEVEQIIGNEEAIYTILQCKQNCCIKHLRMSDSERKEITDSILNRKRPKIILLAILVYLGKSFMIRKLSGQANLHDGALSTLHDTNLDGLFWTELWVSLLDSSPEFSNDGSSLHQRREIFLENYAFATKMFDVPIFSTSSSWISHYPEDQRLPFLDDELHFEGTATEIRKFNIHPLYIDIDPKFNLRDWYRSKSKHKFARKILRGREDRLSRRLEMNSLKAISAQDHPNIIELLFVFQWRDQFSFVFPFVERDLCAVLHSSWHPTSAENHSDVPLEKNWLWCQMLHVASGLKTIHDPEKPCPGLGTDAKLLGCHFDLKPANILVTEQGILKITDFGQAIFKITDAEGSTNAFYRGGSLVYQPPEASTFTSSTNFSELTRQHRRYDVWSLACIMFEVLEYVLAGGSADEKGKKALELFEKERSQEPTGEAYYTSVTHQPKLKRCVARTLAKYGTQAPEFNADQSYLCATAALLNRMFNVNRQARPTSSDVHTELEQLFHGLDFVKRNEEQITSLVKSHPTPSKYLEVGWRDSGWRRMDGTRTGPMNSFLQMNQVRLLTRENVITQSGGRPCNIRVLYSKNKKKLVIDTFLDKDIKQNEFPLDTSRYFPMHKFLSSAAEPLRCALVNNDCMAALSFQDHDDLKNFQAAIVQHQIVQGFSCKLENLTLQRVGSPSPELFNHGNIEVQVWAFKKPESMDVGTSRSGHRPSSRRIIIFEYSSRQIINIPLSSRTYILNDQENNERLSPRSLTIVPNKALQFRNFLFSVSKTEKEELGPSLPLSETAFDEIQNDEKAKLIELKFRLESSRQTFRNILDIQNDS